MEGRDSEWMRFGDEGSKEEEGETQKEDEKMVGRERGGEVGEVVEGNDKGWK